MDKLTDIEIISDLAKGGSKAKRAFTIFYNRYSKKIKSELIYFEKIPHEEANDVFQDTCLKVIQSAKSFSGDSPLAWIKTIARNTARDYWRRQNKFTPLENPELIPADSWSEPTKTQRVDDCVQGSLSKFQKLFPERYFVLNAQLDGLTVEEIGKLINRSAAATKEFISQSKKKLTPYLQNCTHLMS